MSFDWIHENPPYWDDGKEAIVGGAPQGIFDLSNYRRDEVIPGEWWRVEQDGRLLGYGWMDATWGDAEVLLAVDLDGQKKGVGSFIVEQLEREAASRGLRYLYNVVRSAHPDVPGITRWLKQRGFARSHDNETLRRPVRLTEGD